MVIATIIGFVLCMLFYFVCIRNTYIHRVESWCKSKKSGQRLEIKNYLLMLYFIGSMIPIINYVLLLAIILSMYLIGPISYSFIVKFKSESIWNNIFNSSSISNFLNRL